MAVMNKSPREAEVNEVGTEINRACMTGTLKKTATDAGRPRFTQGRSILVCSAPDGPPGPYFISVIMASRG